MPITFTKLFSSITESTIWMQPDQVRLVWITMLAMADRKGRVFASIPGLAHRARVTLEDAEEALKIFLSPDPHSRTTEHEGRRIEPIEGGWRLLTYEKHRAMMDEESVRESKREWARRKRAESKNGSTDSTIEINRAESRQAEAEAEAEAECITPPIPPSRGKRGGARKLFIRPAPDEVQAHLDEKYPDADFSGSDFVAHYAAVGWMVGKNPMKNWKAAVYTWVSRRERQMA
jgi:hypothetical protein